MYEYGACLCLCLFKPSDGNVCCVAGVVEDSILALDW